MTTTLLTNGITTGYATLDTGTTSAPQYTARAWARFNGTGTLSVQTSGNVTSITDLGTGLYRLNFTTSVASSYAWAGTTDYNKIMSNQSPPSLLTSSLQVRSIGVNPNSVSDGTNVSVIVFR